MGTWGMGLFDDDAAADIRGDYSDALSSGLVSGRRNQAILTNLQDAPDELGEDPVIWIALAAVQLEQGALEPIVHEHVSAALDANLANWQADDLASKTDTENRAAVLADLRVRLLASPTA